MAQQVSMVNPTTGLRKTGFIGFSWTTFFWGWFVPLFRGDFKTFIGAIVVWFILFGLTAGIGAIIAQFVWCFMYNKYYTRNLIEQGYRLSDTQQRNAMAKLALGMVRA